MRLRVLVIVAALGMGGCATSSRLTVPVDSAPSTDAVVHLMGRFTGGQACAVGSHVALTAAHIPDKRPFDTSVPLYPHIWSSDSGRWGVLLPRLGGTSLDRDLSIMDSREPFEEFVVPAETPPLVGDSLWLVGYDWRGAERAYSKRVHKATVTRIQAGHIIVRTDAEPGSSGSCVLNADGNLVGIFVARTEGFAWSVGIAVGTWGPLMPNIEKQEPEILRLELKEE